MAVKNRILGIDPGTTFSGYSIVDIKNEQAVWVESGLFKNLLKSVDKDTHNNVKPFIKEVRGLLKEYTPDAVVMESFMVRMSHQSNLMAPISIMIGIVLHMCNRRGIKFFTIMPNTWKRKLERDFKRIDDIYDMSYPVKDRMPNHIFDSYFQALFAGGDQCYKNLNESKIEQLKKKLANSTTLRASIAFVNNKESERRKAVAAKSAQKKKRKLKK